MADTKRFHLGDVLSVTTGKLLTAHIGGIYNILNFMTGDNLFTHQLPRACDECAPYLRQQFPQIADETATEVTGENWKEWMEVAEERYGAWFDVAPLPEHAHEFIDPMSELAEKVHPDRIIVVAAKPQ